MEILFVFLLVLVWRQLKKAGYDRVEEIPMRFDWFDRFLQAGCVLGLLTLPVWIINESARFIENVSRWFGGP